jgi:hypothetical protein
MLVRKPPAGWVILVGNDTTEVRLGGAVLEEAKRGASRFDGGEGRRARASSSGFDA